MNLEDCNEEQPYIAKVLEIKAEAVKVQWMKGGYKKSWVELVHGVGRNRNPSIDDIPLKSIMMFGFKLTQKGMLKKESVKQIKELYNDDDVGLN